MNRNTPNVTQASIKAKWSSMAKHEKDRYALGFKAAVDAEGFIAAENNAPAPVKLNSWFATAQSNAL
jgi:hypothetical protein